MLASRLRLACARASRCAFSSSAAASSPAPLPLTVLTDEEESLRSAAAVFARSAVLPHVRSMDAAAQIRPDVFKGLFDGGFMGVEIPQERGGAGAGFLSACLVVEELAKVDASVAVACDVQNTLVNNVFAMYASDAQRARWQPRLAADTVGSFALSEPSSGSDAFALKTRAARDGDGWRLTGSKLWITNAEVAGVFLVFATVDPAAGYKGITCFIVERGADGFSVGKPEDKLGIRASSTCPLALDGVRVPAGAVLGEVGKGYKIAIELLNEGRVGIAAQMVGIAQGAFDATQPYLAERKQFGSRIADFQAIQHQVAQAAVDIEAARLLTYNAARRKMAKMPFAKEAAMAKLFAAQVADRVTGKAIEWCGGMGFVKDFPQEKFWRDSKIGQIYEGTSNVQLSTIAKYLEKERLERGGV